MSAQDFASEISQGYTFKGDSLLLGKAMLDGQLQNDLAISIPLKMMNRHGLISGATGTGNYL